jgi:hypothetical protein
VLIVRAAQQPDAIRIVHLCERESVHVIELQVASLRAPAPMLVDKRAAPW